MFRNDGFTLIELIIVILIITFLGSLVLASAGAMREAANDVVCRNNLRQLGVATRAYLNENGQTYFKYRRNVKGGTQWYFGFESSGGSKKEGEREIDLKRAPLYAYGAAGDVVHCPELTQMYNGPKFKPKFVRQSTSYGYNILLSGKKASRVERPWETILFADCAQINTFQRPASAKNPLVEEFYIMGPGFKTIHFRHGDHANAVFCDGSVRQLYPLAGKQDTRLPGLMIGEAEARYFFLEAARKNKE